MAKAIKGAIKFNLSFCEEQKQAKNLIIDNEVIVITGNPGTGKSSVVAQTVLDLIFRKQALKVTLTRPVIEVGQSLGYLPGEKDAKMAPYLKAFMNSMETSYPHPEKISELLDKKIVTTDAIQFIRGTNVRDREILIVEEVQNCSVKEIEAIVTRLSGGKIILLGDLRQCDIRQESGLSAVIKYSTFINGIKHIHLKENHRSGIVKELIDHLYGVE